jgi:hypothetical protein
MFYFFNTCFLPVLKCSVQAVSIDRGALDTGRFLPLVKRNQKLESLGQENRLKMQVLFYSYFSILSFQFFFQFQFWFLVPSSQWAETIFIRQYRA